MQHNNYVLNSKIDSYTAAELSLPALLSVAEYEGTVQVCATLSLSIDSVVDVFISLTIATRDGTGIATNNYYSIIILNHNISRIAVEGSDYMGEYVDELFIDSVSNGTTLIQCIGVAIIDSPGTAEEDETFTVYLTLNTLPGFIALTLGNAVTTVTITDTAGMCRSIAT